MRFRTYEELETDLIAEQNEQQSAVDYVVDSLVELGFEQSKELNGVSLSQTYDNEDTVYNCQFYMDTEADTYSSYVTSDTDGDKTTTFQQKGPLKDAPRAVDKYTQFLSTI